MYKRYTAHYKHGMELKFVVAVNDIWQLKPYWLHPCKVCDQGRSVDKIKFTRNRKMVGGLESPPPEFLFQKKIGTAEINLKSRTHNGAF